MVVNARDFGNLEAKVEHQEEQIKHLLVSVDRLVIAVENMRGMLRSMFTIVGIAGAIVGALAGELFQFIMRG